MERSNRHLEVRQENGFVTLTIPPKFDQQLRREPLPKSLSLFPVVKIIDCASQDS
jgi:hypothetical protein